MNEKIASKIEETIRALKASYGSKYSESNYAEFRTEAKAKAKTLKHLIILVENLFDLDHSDAHDMVN